MIWIMENPRTPIDRVHQVVLETLIGTLGTPSRANMGRY
jgi:hypothetical protein